ncbi:unnamed protein product [Protopolystoma xenopodis]|uniref:Uncharacterized protein n=1 Tax=Protopolystoma xenopodis TaxID=117903 RepID=A0A3S4ZYU8_9PLAT|nr:unnamed protein product [Protopolystoma xenopodis]
MTGLRSRSARVFVGRVHNQNVSIFSQPQHVTSTPRMLLQGKQVSWLNGRFAAFSPVQSSGNRAR